MLFIDLCVDGRVCMLT